MNGSTIISDIIIRQYEKTWDMLKCLVASCPESEWLAGPTASAVPVRHVYHVLGGAEWCCEEDRFATTNPFALALSIELFREDLPATGWPDRQTMLKMIADIQRRIGSRIAGMTDAQWLAGARTPMDFGQTDLEQFVYMIRHCQHHVGELRSEFRRRGIALPEWA